MTDADAGPASGWLDMSRYPDLDPDRAVPDSTLRTVLDFLLSHEVTPLPDPAWDALVGSALLAGSHTDARPSPPPGDPRRHGDSPVERGH